jgi:NTP pyrophosphatase (non-canonical NTP hydrolase)
MLNKEQEKTLQKMLNKFQDKQMIIAVEELSELQKEVCKKLRKPYSSNDALIEELADVYIMLNQIRMYYDVDINDVNYVIDKKIERTKKLYLEVK